MEKITHENTLNRTRNYTKVIFYSCIFVFSLVWFSVSSEAAQAASLYSSPSAGSYTVGQSFSVSVYVSSPDQAMNAASGVISFPEDKLEITSLSKVGSIINLWVQEPSFSNGAGTVNFEGIVLNPGFKGQGGKIITANFKVRSAGSGHLSFSSAAVLANDGKGTNILENTMPVEFNLNLAAIGPQAPEATTASGVAGAPFAPWISSPTHPNPERWYSDKNPKFIWDVPDGVNQVRLLYDKYPTSRPTVLYNQPISEKSLEDIKDGIWYLHAQFKNANGWGAISHFRFQIDTELPARFAIEFVDSRETDNPRPTVIFDTTDSLSGIDYYKIKVGEGDFFNLPPEIVKSNPYTLPPQAPGKRLVLVQAFDKAGNYRTATEEFIIKSIKAPVFTDFSRELQSGEILTARGKTYPNVLVTIYLQKDKDEPVIKTAKSDEKGDFIFIAEEPLAADVYKLWAEVTDERGAKSDPSDEIIIAVRGSTLWQIGSRTVSLLAVIVPLVALLVVFILIIWYGWQKFRRLRKRLKKEVGGIEQTLHKAFDSLREDVQEGIGVIEKTRARRQLTEEEEKMLKHLKRSLDNTEKILRAEIEEIEKEVK